MNLARRILTPLFVLIAVYLGVLCKPQPLFAWSVASQNLTLYSDRPFNPSTGAHARDRGGDSIMAALYWQQRT